MTVEIQDQLNDKQCGHPQISWKSTSGIIKYHVFMAVRVLFSINFNSPPFLACKNDDIMQSILKTCITELTLIVFHWCPGLLNSTYFSLCPQELQMETHSLTLPKQGQSNSEIRTCCTLPNMTSSGTSSEMLTPNAKQKDSFLEERYWGGI